jgi:hypothetical protein
MQQWLAMFFNRRVLKITEEDSSSAMLKAIGFCFYLQNYRFIGYQLSGIIKRPECSLSEWKDLYFCSSKIIDNETP